MSVRAHLRSRGLDPDRQGVFVSEETGTATVLLYNLSGQIVGYQQYNPEGTKSIRNDEKHRSLLKYFTFVGDEGDGQRAGRKKLADDCYNRVLGRMRKGDCAHDDEQEATPDNSRGLFSS